MLSSTRLCAPRGADTKYRGEFEQRLRDVIEEVTKSNDTILFIDELHTLVGAGAAEGAIDAANLLKPSLARGELQCIGATTIAEYRQYIEKDAALERRFQVRASPQISTHPWPSLTLCANAPTNIRGLRSHFARMRHVPSRCEWMNQPRSRR